ncbi:MAG: TetR/AcrR family transcriptional regulator [Pseudomonadota bacterium]
MEIKTDTRECILEAAIKRFLHYGYAKTTMSEIARDCSMSAGNIYRFFASKLDIAEAMARKFNVEFQQSLAQISREPRPACERLYRVFDHGLRATFQKLDEDAKILEVAEVLARDRPAFANEEMAQERIHIVKILKDGVDTGEFAPIKDPVETAEMIQSAMMKFKYPQLFSRLSLDQLVREMDGVMALLMAGLKSGQYAQLHTSAD